MVYALARGLKWARAQRAFLGSYQFILSVSEVSEKLFVFLRLPNHIMRQLPDRYDEVLQELVLVPGWEERRAYGQLVQDAADTPHVDRVVVLDSEDDFRRSIVTTLYVKESRGAVLATCAKIYKFDLVELVVGEEYVLRLHIAVDNPFVLHVFQALAYLFRYHLQLLRIECLLASFVHLLIFVQIEAQTIKHNDDVLPEPEMVYHVHQAIEAFVVALEWRRQLFQEMDLHVRIVHVKLFVL